MVDALIILIVIILLFIALKGSVKHFKGEGSCCKGGSSILKTGEKKLDGPVVSEKRIRVSGMHCENCAETVKRAIDSIDGASGSVDYRSGIAIVRTDRTIDDIVIKKKLEDSGYKVDSIS